MGDRCAVRITVKNQDVQKILDLLGEEPECTYEDEGTTELEFTECNYAWDKELKALAAHPDCPPFIGHHGDGGNYGPELFAKDGGLVLWVNCDWDGDPCVSYQDGKPSVRDLDLVERYFSLKAEFENYVGRAEE